MKYISNALVYDVNAQPDPFSPTIDAICSIEQFDYFIIPQHLQGNLQALAERERGGKCEYQGKTAWTEIQNSVPANRKYVGFRVVSGVGLVDISWLGSCEDCGAEDNEGCGNDGLKHGLAFKISAAGVLFDNTESNHQCGYLGSS
jgi:hypothetical protein